jgi:hypothetical protein
VSFPEADLIDLRRRIAATRWPDLFARDYARYARADCREDGTGMTTYPTIVPRIITPDVGGVVDFMRTVFDAQGEVHEDRPAALRIGNSIVLVSDGGGVSFGVTPTRPVR